MMSAFKTLSERRILPAPCARGTTFGIGVYRLTEAVQSNLLRRMPVFSLMCDVQHNRPHALLSRAGGHPTSHVFHPAADAAFSAAGEATEAMTSRHAARLHLFGAQAWMLE